MTIKDIAKAANVSVATVSRIINHKDGNISQETRERVQRIIDEVGYVPYAKIRDRILSQTNSIGLVIPTLESAFYVRFASQIQQLASASNYSLALSLSGGSPETEQAALQDFSRNHVDGIICFPTGSAGIDTLRELNEQGMAVVTLDHSARPVPFPQIYQDAEDITRCCTQLLLDSNARQIGLILREDSLPRQRELLISGYTAALTAAGLPVVQDFIISSGAHFLENFRIMSDAGLDSVVCQDTDLARMVYAAAATDGLQIPDDLSVVSIEDTADAAALTPPLTAAAIDVAQAARAAFDCLLSQISHSPLPFTSLRLESPIRAGGSVRQRRNPKPKILVTGYINTDVLLGARELPQMGRTQVASHLADFEGGTGANQAYGISNLGGNVYLMGCLGSDRRGRRIYDRLNQAGVKMDGVSFIPGAPTGTAYISLYPNGKSSVLINPGANTSLDAAYIRRHQALLKDAGYCLVQTDIPIDAVLALRELCDQRGIPMVLSPAYVEQLPDRLLEGLYLLTPSERDARMLCPDLADIADLARWFVERGVQNVVISGGVSGSVWATREGIVRFPAYDYPSVDGTGTNDVFVGSLVTLLSEGHPLEKAIGAATWAAAYSTTKLGVQSGFPSPDLLHDVLSGHVRVQIPGEK